MHNLASNVKFVWMPSVCYVPNYNTQNSVYLYLVPLVLHCIGNLLAYVAALCIYKFGLVFVNCQGDVAQMREEGTRLCVLL